MTRIMIACRVSSKKLHYAAGGTGNPWPARTAVSFASIPFTVSLGIEPDAALLSHQPGIDQRTNSHRDIQSVANQVQIVIGQQHFDTQRRPPGEERGRHRRYMATPEHGRSGQSQHPEQVCIRIGGILDHRPIAGDDSARLLGKAPTVTVAVSPATSRIPFGTVSIRIWTGIRCASRTQVKTGLTEARPRVPGA